jgi:hypothetical protein
MRLRGLNVLWGPIPDVMARFIRATYENMPEQFRGRFKFNTVNSISSFKDSGWPA